MRIDLERLKNTMTAQVYKNDITANNLANINTTGYKKDIAFAQLVKDSVKLQVEVKTNFSQGQLETTDNPLDIAIRGRGFFTILKDGQEFYTRNGHFNISSYGILQTSDGLPVLGDGGEINLSRGDLTVGEILISDHGEIYIDDDYAGNLKIVDFDDYKGLQKKGQNLFAADPRMVPEVLDEPDLQQGKLEGSNVNPLQEMVKLIELQRNFESSQRAITTIDRAEGKAANEISRY